MEWPKVALQNIAPAQPSLLKLSPDAIVWNLTLDQIESNTGNIINKLYKPMSEAGTSTFIFDECNVLYSKLRPYLNKVIMANEVGLATTELLPLRPNKKLLKREYLVYFLRSPAFVSFISNNVTGTKMPRVIMDTFWNYEIPLPTLSEQRRVVEILDQADCLRKLRVQANAKAERVLPALFIKMFGDPAMNPKKLRKDSLGNLIRVRSGSFLPARNMDEEGVYPVYGGNGINGYHSEYMFKDRKIVIGRVGAYCGVVHYSENNCWVTDNALYVEEKSNDLHDEYLFYALHLSNLNQYAGRAGQPLISGSRIYPVEILVPDSTDQQIFVKHYRVIAEQFIKCRQAKEKIEDTFNLLLHHAFSGTLTAKWREAHMTELLAEMEIQAKSFNDH